MELIKTKSFELATLIEGDRNSEKLAIIIPGRLDTKDYASCVSHVKYLSKKGFLAVAFDPPGTWDSPGDIELYTTTNNIKAVNEIIKRLGNKPTLLVGHSRGGAISMLVAVSNPSVMGIVVVMASFGIPTPPEVESLKDGYKVSHRDLPPGSSKTKEQKEFRLPMRYFEDAEQYDPVTAIQGLKKPKLVCYGTKDRFVAPEEVRQIYENTPNPKMIQEFDSEHDYRLFPKVIEGVEKAMDKFLREHLEIA